MKSDSDVWAALKHNLQFYFLEMHYSKLYQKPIFFFNI